MPPPEKHPLYQVKLVREGRPSYTSAISRPCDAASFFQKRFGKSIQEHFLVLCLNARNVPLGWREVSRGTLNASLVHPREVFLPAIMLAAGSLILIHNHPSSDPTPNREDIDLERLIIYVDSKTTDRRLTFPINKALLRVIGVQFQVALRSKKPLPSTSAPKPYIRDSIP